jgi:hypothetical protein
MAKQEWIDLLKYSTKYGVSLSTLRRRIKSNSIPHKLEHGKYYLEDVTPSEKPGAHTAQVLNETPSKATNTISSGAASGSRSSTPPVTMAIPSAPELQASNFVEASVLSSANRLVEEIKAAYSKILQEKEEQITQLKEQVVDLKMLVNILEANSKASQSAGRSRDQASDQANDQANEEEPQKPSRDDFGSDDFIFGDFQSRDL